MSQSHVAVLNQILSQTGGFHPEMDEAELFEFFAAKQVLREFLVDNDDIQSGLVGQSSVSSQSEMSGYAKQIGTDGGIDGMYLFVNGDLIRDEDQAEGTKTLKRNIHVDFVIIQASTESGFRIQRILRLKDTSENIFTIDRPEDQFTERYSEPLLDAINRFRVLHKNVAAKFPEVHLSYFYVTKGDIPTKPSSDLLKKAESLIDNVKGILPTISQCTFTFVGAKELCELSTKQPKISFDLKCIDNISEHGAYIALVPLPEYYKFITNEKDEKREHLFDANVRGYQGAVDVNEAIRKTLSGAPSGGEDFWWLNNGITIVCSRVGGDNRRLTLEDPQVVNGYQTSQEIYEYFKPSTTGNVSSESGRLLKETRNIAVRIIKVPSIEVQDLIIRATNSQTSIPPAYLWATDPIHRDIERLFSGVGLYYDRRKNSWRTNDIPSAKVVGIAELAQSVASIYLQEPDHARARPARYFKEKEYRRVFSEELLEIYPVCAALRKRADVFLRKNEPEKRHRNNLIFYVLMGAVCAALRTPKAKAARLKSLAADSVTDQHFFAAFMAARHVYQKYGSSDKAAKGPDVLADLKVEMRRKYGQSKSKPGKLLP